MLRLIIRKELHDNFLNVRFLAACAISLVLILASIVVLARSEGERERDYQSRVAEQEDFVDHFSHWNRLSWMSQQRREPSHLRALVLGIDDEAQQENFISNPLPVLLSRLDFVSIVTIVMSLIAILFSYNAICGEREAGLLRLLLASGVPRRKLLVGKFLGGLISVTVPFTISVLAGLIVLALSPSLQLEPADFAVFGALLLASYLYVAAFFAIGLLFSASSQTSGQAILKSLFAWVILVLVIPNISPFLAAQLSPIPSAAKTAQEIDQIVDRERDQIVARRSKELIESNYPDLRELTSLPQAAVVERLAASPTLRERYKQFSQAQSDLLASINKDQQAKAEKIEADFQKRSDAQEDLARVFTSASPYANFVFIATDLTETGIASEAHWREQAGEYSRALGSFADARYKKEMEKNPAYSFNDYLDLRDRPRFHYEPASFAVRFGPNLVQWGVLAVFVLVFFMIAYARFHRYDVR
ncbi:MAG TPA: ABC transporter permease subunit [Bacteroidota bacterium]|nr:ABC transporter permease subunit [Bacteroidota bacterium]